MQIQWLQRTSEELQQPEWRPIEIDNFLCSLHLWSFKSVNRSGAYFPCNLPFYRALFPVGMRHAPTYSACVCPFPPTFQPKFNAVIAIQKRIKFLFWWYVSSRVEGRERLILLVLNIWKSCSVYLNLIIKTMWGMTPNKRVKQKRISNWNLHWTVRQHRKLDFIFASFNANYFILKCSLF